MSDISGGPGWWIASDGKWYPHHLHPSVRVDPPTPAEDTPFAASPATGSPTEPTPVSPRFVGSAPISGPAPTALSILVVLLLVAGAFVVFGDSKSASAEVIDAVNSTLGAKTAQITLNESITTAGKTVTANGTGAMDFTHAALRVELNATIAGQLIPIEVDEVAGEFYEKIPGLDQLVPGKTWISVNLSSLQNSSAQAPDPSAQGVGANPSVILRMLAQQGNKVVALGPSTVDGVAVNGYAVTVNASRVAQQLKRADLPSWMRQALVGLKAQNINLKVFVDDSGLLRSFEFQTTESSGSGTIDINETLGFSHYGTPVSVTTPPAAQVEGFQQFLQAEQAQARPAS